MVLSLIIEAIAKIAGYSLVLYGLWMIVGDRYLKGALANMWNARKRRRSFKRMQEVQETEPKDKNAISRHIEILMLSVERRPKDNPVMRFMAISLTLLAVTFIVVYMLIGDGVISLINGLFFGSLPYIILRFRLANKRIRTSKAFMDHYTTILQNYQMAGNSVYYTILNTAKDIEDKTLKSDFMKLSSSLQKNQDDETFRASLYIFVFSINSIFAKRFGTLILKGYLHNTNINQTLLELNEDIRKRKNDQEQEKTNKLETVLVCYAPVVLVPIMVFASYQVSGVTDYWYIFQQKTPLILFSISLVMMIVSALIGYIHGKPRSDI